MKSKILWKVTQSQKNISNLFRYEKFLFSKYKVFNCFHSKSLFFSKILKILKFSDIQKSFSKSYMF